MRKKTLLIVTLGVLAAAGLILSSMSGTAAEKGTAQAISSGSPAVGSPCGMRGGCGGGCGAAVSSGAYPQPVAAKVNCTGNCNAKSCVCGDKKKCDGNCDNCTCKKAKCDGNCKKCDCKVKCDDNCGCGNRGRRGRCAARQ